MALFYKIAFTKQLNIDDLVDLVEKLNQELSTDNIMLQDFNVELYEDDKVLEEKGENDLVILKKDHHYTFSWGYFIATKMGEKREHLEKFKQAVLFFDKNTLHVGIKGVYVQEGQITVEENWVEIP